MGGRVGILTGANIGRAVEAFGQPLDNLGALGDLAERFHHPQVWVHRSALGALGLPPELSPSDPSALARQGIAHPWVGVAMGDWQVKPTGLSYFHVLRRRDGAGSVDVGILPYDPAAGLGEAEPANALGALELYRHALGVPYRWSPGAVGCGLMQRRHRGRLGPSTHEPPPPALDGGTETDAYWSRPAMLGERLMRWVHAYDANGRYLAACSSVELGRGEPEHLLPKGSTLGFDKRQPGYWRANIGHTPAPFGELWPDPFGGREGWYATPTVELAEQLGALGTIHEAYVWPEHSRYLAPWAELIRGARAECMTAWPNPPSCSAASTYGPEAARLALGLVKRTYVMALGSIAGHYRVPGDELHRPDWRHQVIALSRANLMRRILTMPAPPLAVDVDCVYVASDLDASTAATGLPLGDQLGAFKLVGSVPMAAALEALEQPEGLYRLGRLVKGGAP